jgi:hypothetical protein
MNFVGIPTFGKRAMIVAVYALAMAYLESAVVVYLQRALAMTPATLFPLRDQTSLGGLGSIEVGREVATLIMLVTIGWLAGSSSIERLAWTSVAFGIWDITYYFWLWVFIGWPTSLGTTDLLFLMPVPWVAPVSAPILVSLALIGFGLLFIRRVSQRASLSFRPRDWILLVSGGVVVIVSFTIDATYIRNGGMPAPFAWPVFTIGMVVAVLGVVPPLMPNKSA